MIRQFLKEGSIYSLANMATKVVSLLLIPFYTFHFSTSDYGVLDYFVVFNSLFHAVVSLQIGQGVARYLGDPDLSELEKKKIVSTGTYLFLLLYLVFTGILYLTTSFWTQTLTSDHSISDSIFKLSVINLFVVGLTQQFGIYLRYRRKTTAFALLNIVQSLVSILLIVLFVLYGKMGIESVFWASIFVAIAIAGIQFWILRSDHFLYLGKTELRRILSFSAPYIPAAVSLILLDMTDRVFIAKYLSVEQLGIYGLGAKFPAVLTLLVSGFGMALGPLVMESYQQETTKIKLNQLLKSYLTAGGICVLILALFSYETLIVFTNKNYYPAKTVMPLLYFVSFLNGLSMFNTIGLFISKKMHLSAISTACFTLLNVGLNFYLVPRFGILGAAVSTLISFLANTLVIFLLSGKFYFIISFKRLVLPIFLLLAGIVLVLLMERLNMPYYNLFLMKILFATGLFVLLILLYKKQLKNQL